MTPSENTPEQELQVMVWYRREDWPTLKTLFADAHLLPPTFERWLELAEAKVKEVEASGDLVAKVTIDTVLFPAWCREKGRSLDAEARTTFAIEAIHQQQIMGSL